ncbi:hypothetical protein BMS3Bbin04_00159 [bacterium BMS3Bbin04]|nr:hypothetical protein BMS3Bbin04_00159 [bacterium BMS3Bbin04]
MLIALAATSPASDGQLLLVFCEISDQLAGSSIEDNSARRDTDIHILPAPPGHLFALTVTTIISLDTLPIAKIE